MARVDSDSDGNASPRSKKKTTQISPKRNRVSPEVDDNADKSKDITDKDSGAGNEGDEEEEKEEEEEEYEIEEIIDAKKGTFPGGRLGYLVKWKGYDSNHNSWVDEMDAGNATDLIDTFWKKNKKGKGSRKSLDPKSKSVKAGTKLFSKEDGSEVGSTSVVKKRGRPPKSKVEKEDTDQEDSDNAPKKKPRKSNGTDSRPKKGGAGKKTLEVTQDDEDQEMEDIPVGSMEKHMKVPSWEHIVDFVDTVERTPKGDLDVFFRLVTGDRVKEDSRVCALRFPQKLIAFYESNLRWKVSDSDS